MTTPGATNGEKEVARVRSPLRQWLKDRKRSVKRTKALDLSGAVFLSPGKSGRTWVRAMLSHAFHLAFDTPIDELISDDNLQRLDRRVPAVLFTHGTGEPPALVRRLTARGLRKKCVIALVRDPRDVLVSRYHHYHNRSVRFVRQHSNDQQSPVAVGDFILRGQRIERLVARIDELRELTTALPNGHLFQYEALRREPAAQLERLLKAMGCAVDDAHIEAAVAFTEFERLQKREAERFYQSEILRPGDPEQPNSFKVRRGQVGGYKDELTADEVEQLDQRIDALMVEGLGYRSDEQVVLPPAATA